MDNYSSYKTKEFQTLCEENNIYTLCMPPHSSHLLQPLDVGCFAPLKKAYKAQINELISCYVNHVSKLEFLPAFKAAYQQSITSSNIYGAFRGVGLVPFDPQAVLLKIRKERAGVHTPPKQVLPDALWESQTPSNARELKAQSALLREKIRRRVSSTPPSIIDVVQRLTKGAKLIMHQAVLLRAEVTTLQRVNEAVTKRRSRKKRRIQKHGSLTIAEGAEIVSQMEVVEQLQQERRQEAEQSGTSLRSAPRCSRCKEPGHNLRTCKAGATATPAS